MRRFRDLEVGPGGYVLSAQTGTQQKIANRDALDHDVHRQSLRSRTNVHFPMLVAFDADLRKTALLFWARK